MIENILVERAQCCTVALDLCREVSRYLRESGVQIRDIAKIRVEPTVTIQIAVDHSRIAGFEHADQQSDLGDAFVRNPVFRHEPGQLPIGIEHERLLVGTIDIAVEQRRKHVHGVFGADRTGAQRCYLAFEHEVQAAHAGVVLVDIQEVVGMIELVGAHVGPNAVIDDFQRARKHLPDVFDRALCATRKCILTVDLRPVFARNRAELVENREALFGTDRSAEQGVDVAECRCRFPDPVADFQGNICLAGLRRKQLLQEADIAAHVAERDHRQALSDQRVVRVVPFRALCVQPDSAVGHQVAELRQQGHEELLEQIDLIYVASRVHDELAVRTDVRHALCYQGFEIVIEFDSALRILEDGVEGFDPIGHVRIAEDRLVQQCAQLCGVEMVRKLEQLQQVDDLVIAPVPDVTPGIVRILDLPVDAFLGNAIGIEAIHG